MRYLGCLNSRLPVPQRPEAGSQAQGGALAGVVLTLIYALQEKLVHAPRTHQLRSQTTKHVCFLALRLR